MKKSLLICGAVAMALISCTKEMNPSKQGDRESTQVEFNLSATHPNDTKAVKTEWETGDVIFVFFSKQSAPKYLEMKWNGTAWVSEGKNSLALAENEYGTMTAVYLPFGSNATVTTYNSTKFKFSSTYETYYLTAKLNYHVVDSKVSGTFNMQIPDGYVQFFLDDADANPETEMELREPKMIPQGIEYIAADGTITLTEPVSGAPLKGYVYDKENKTGSESKGWVFSGILADEAQDTPTDYHFTLVSGGWTGNYYYKAFSSKTLYTGDTAGRALKLPVLSDWTAITDYKPIDLGCEVQVGGKFKRVYWASRNLGATADTPAGSSTEELQATWGDYYAWGETAPYYTAGAYSSSPTWAAGKSAEGYAWSSYRWGNYNALAKYNETDELATLEAVDDAATANVSPVGRWRMPTNEEWHVLCDPTYYSRTWSNSQKGYTITRKEGTYFCVGHSIFLPAAGERGYENLLYTDKGYYWSSSLRTTQSPRTQAFLATFSSTGFSTNYDLRFLGMLIRPVCD